MKERNIAVSIILSLVTCGIYGIYWFISLTNEVKEAAHDDKLASGGLALVFTIITCGIYGLYWSYQIGKLISKAQSDRNLPSTDNSIVFLVLELFGLGIVVWSLAQDNLNKIVLANPQSTEVA